MTQPEQAPQPRSPEQGHPWFEAATIALQGVLYAVRYANGTLRSQVMENDGTHTTSGLVRWVEIRRSLHITERVDEGVQSYVVAQDSNAAEASKTWRLIVPNRTGTYEGEEGENPMTDEHYRFIIDQVPNIFSTVLRSDPQSVVFPQRPLDQIVELPGDFL